MKKIYALILFISATAFACSDTVQPDIIILAPSDIKDAEKYLGKYADPLEKGGARISSDHAYELRKPANRVKCDGDIETTSDKGSKVSITGKIEKILSKCGIDASASSSQGTTFELKCGDSGYFIEAEQRYWMGVYDNCCKKDGKVRKRCEPSRRVVERIAKGDLKVSDALSTQISSNISCIIKEAGEAGLSTTTSDVSSFNFNTSGFGYIQTTPLKDVCKRYNPPCGKDDEVPCDRGCADRHILGEDNYCHKCGMSGYIPCDGAKPEQCNSGLAVDPSDNTCTKCGGTNEPACVDRGDNAEPCEEGLIAINDLCNRCGGTNNPPCKAPYLCESGHIIKENKCIACGASGQPGCPECTEPYTVDVGGSCVPCGSIGERVCDNAKKGCKPGLVRKSGKCLRRELFRIGERRLTGVRNCDNYRMQKSVDNECSRISIERRAYNYTTEYTVTAKRYDKDPFTGERSCFIKGRGECTLYFDK